MHLQTTRLSLRPVCAEDVDALFRIFGDPETNRFNPAGPYPDIAYAQNVLTQWLVHWQQYGFGKWAISLQEEPAHIIGFGGITLSHYADLTINNLGYRFSTEVWGKGLATELSLAALHYGFEQLQLTEISAAVRGDHLASQKVLTKSGLHFLREIHDVENAAPSLLYGITVEQWHSAL